MEKRLSAAGLKTLPALSGYFIRDGGPLLPAAAAAGGAEGKVDEWM